MKTLRSTAKNYLSKKAIARNTIAFITASLLCTATLANQADLDAIERAYYSDNVPALKQLAEATRGYDHFVASYRLALKYSFSNQEEAAKSQLASLIEELETHTQANPSDADSLALLANVYGYSIGLNPFKAMTYGPRSHDRIDTARTIAEDNPRVLMFQGILDYNTPAMFGGSKEAAKVAFTEALDAFEKDQGSDRYWGHSETSVWLGLTYLEQGDLAMARHCWQQALTLNPDNSWATHLLESNKAEQ